MLLNCIVYSISQNMITDYNYGVETDNLPIQGLSSDLKVYGEYYTNEPIPFDSRVLQEIVTKTRIDSPHPAYPSLLTYQITYSLVRRSLEEITESIRVAENYANEQLNPNVGRTSKEAKINGALRKKAESIELDQDETELLDWLDQINDAMDDNADNAQNLIDYTEADEENIPDLNSGWTTTIEQ